ATFRFSLAPPLPHAPLSPAPGPGRLSLTIKPLSLRHRDVRRKRVQSIHRVFWRLLECYRPLMRLPDFFRLPLMLVPGQLRLDLRKCWPSPGVDRSIPSLRQQYPPVGGERGTSRLEIGIP